MNQQTAQTVPDWLHGIAAPLVETPCGEDPRYLVEFQCIKEETDKLRDVDYAMVMATCRDLLTRTTKDLRVAGYLLVAAVYVDGLPGLLDSLKVYRTLLDNFWEDCHPLSESARLSALNLLGNPRIVAFAELQEEQTTAEIFKALQQEIGQIHTFLKAKLGEEAPGLSRLAPWIADRVQGLKSIEPARDDCPKPPTQQSSSSITSPATQEVNSEQGVETLTRQIHNYLINAGDLLRALAYSRAFRWGKFTLPPHEEYRTRIPTPRASGLAELDNSLSGNLLESTLACCENLFFEPGFQLLFDLQFKLFQYLEANHRSDLSRFIQNALQELLERHPELLELQFEDGTPFANPECRQWVQQNSFAHINKADKTLENEISVDESLASLIETATQLAKRKKLPEALHSLHVLPEGTEQQRIQKHLAQARLCLAAGKAKMADVILEEIQKTIQAYHLVTWNPGLALEILQQRLTTLQSLKKSSSGEEKQRISQQWHEVWHLICKIDVASAAALNMG